MPNRADKIKMCVRKFENIRANL